MQIIQVKFYAFGRPMKEVFHNDETMEQIHDILYNICSTYEVIEIATFALDTNLPLSNLHKFRNKPMPVKPKKSDVLAIHATLIENIVFLDVAVCVAPSVFTAYTIKGNDYSEYMVGRCIDRKEKITPQRAAVMFNDISKGYKYEL